MNTSDKEKDFIKTIMNPVRLRIVQYLMLHGKGTPGEMLRELSDVPPASLYRHIHNLEENDLIGVAEVKQVRGAVERSYKLKEQPAGEYSKDSVRQMIHGFLMVILGEFERYFEREDADPVRDRIGVSTSALMLSDGELEELTGRIGAVYNDYIENTAGPGRKTRRISFILSPPEQKSNTGQNIKDTEQPIQKGNDNAVNRESQ